MDDNLLQYAPILIVILFFLYKNKLFVRPEELPKMEAKIVEKITNQIEERMKSAKFMTPADFESRRAKFLEYISEYYVSKESCLNHNTYIANEITSIKNDLKEDIKELKNDMGSALKDVQDNVKELTNVIAIRIKQVEK